MSNRIYNYISKPKPDSLYIYKYKTLSTPDYYFIPNTCPILDQDQLGSCVSNASYSTFYIMSNGKIQLSRLQLYFCARGFEKLSLTEDTGLNLLGTLQTIKLYGLTDEENWPYVITNFANLAPAPSFTQLYTLNNYSYANVIQDLAHIKECLILNIPILIGVSVYNSFESTTANSTGVIPMPSSNESLLGGHCIVLVGYDDNSGYFKFQNSWGKKWGDKGYGYLPYNYVTDSTLTHDLYVVHFT